MTSPASANGSIGQEDPKLLDGERKQVTILFADFEGFTTYSAAMDPEDVRDDMNAIWAKLDAIIVAHGGTPEKHAGDAIMAVFGARRSREEDPAQAVRAALSMQGYLKSRKPEDGRPALRMRIGINTGLVVVGPTERAGEFLATGDAVNLASRLEQSAPVGGVLISHETYGHVYGIFDVQAKPLLPVKGKTEPVQTYVILRAKDPGFVRQMRDFEGVTTEMIGRQKELRRLEGAFEEAMHHQLPRLFTIVGEAGIGKSRLLREFHKWIELLPQYIRIFRGRASTETASLPFALIRDLFSMRFEIQENDSAAVAREKFEHGMEGLLGGGAEVRAWSREELMLDIHFLGQLLGLDFSAKPRLRDILGDAEQMRQRAFHGFSRLFAAFSQCPAAGQAPAVSAILLVVEDLHWGDDGSLDLIEQLARDCQGVPLTILCSARPAFFERRPGWGAGRQNVARLNLEPLSFSESNELVATILCKALEIPPSLGELITDGAEGNPFYIEEMIRMLMDQKVIVPQAGQWEIELGRLDNTRIPGTLTGVLQARLDSLTPAERVVLQRASLVGRVFWDSVVEHMGRVGARNAPPTPLFESVLAKDDVALALEGLRRKELVFRRESSTFAGSVEYAFKHELLRNVASESLLKKSRRLHHTRIAEWLMDHSADRLHEFAGLIASHFEQALRLCEAAEWHGRAGQQARMAFAPAMASDHFMKALRLLPPGQAEDGRLKAQQLEWQEGLAETLGAQGRFSEALAACTAMRDLAQQLSDFVAEARGWNGMAFLHERRGDNRASVDCAERAEAVACQASEAGNTERIRALHLKGWAFYRLGDASAVLALGNQTLTLCTERGDRRGTAISFKLLGVAHLQLGHYVEADRFFEQGLALFQELGDRRNAAAMWSNRGESARMSGDYQTAAGLYEKALAIARQTGNRESELIYLANLSGVRLGLGLFEQAETDLRQVIDQTLTPNSCALSEAYAFLGEACLGQGNLPEAVMYVQKAITLAQESESSLNLGEAWRSLGRIGMAALKSAGRVAGGSIDSDLPAIDPPNCFTESLRVFQRINAEGEQARTLRDWGIFELEQGRVAQGRKRLLEAREMFLQLGARFEVATTQALLQAHGEVTESPAAS